METWTKITLLFLLILAIMVVVFTVAGYSLLFIISLFHIAVDFSFSNALFAGGAICIFFWLLGGISIEKQ